MLKVIIDFFCLRASKSIKLRFSLHYVVTDKFLNNILFPQEDDLMTYSSLILSSSLLSLSTSTLLQGQWSEAFGRHCHWKHCGMFQPCAHPVNNCMVSHKFWIHPHHDFLNTILQICSQMPQDWCKTLYLPAVCLKGLGITVACATF